MVKRNGEQKHLEVMVTTKKTNAGLGLDWMKKLGMTLDKDSIDPQIKHIKEDNSKNPSMKTTQFKG